MMKRTLSLLTLSLMFMMTGCVVKHVETTKYIKPEPTYKIVNCPTQNKKGCNNEQVLCAMDTKTVNYVDACDGACAFPVTVRKNSNCKEGGIK